MSEKLEISVSVGCTFRVQNGPMANDSDFLKPSVMAKLSFDEIPDEGMLREKWEWLWDNQVGPQSEAIIELMVEQAVQNGLTRLVDKHKANPKVKLPEVNGDYT